MDRVIGDALGHLAGTWSEAHLRERRGRFARIAMGMGRSDRPSPTNDVCIGTHAMESGADRVSFDRRLREIDGLA